MKRLREILGQVDEGVLDTIGTGFHQVLNPIRRKFGIQTGELPAGTKEIDYSAIGNKALGVLDTAMSGFGGADPGKTRRKIPPTIVTPDKPLVTGKPNSALTAAGYDQSGKKISLKGMQYDNPDVSGSLLKGFRYDPDNKEPLITKFNGKIQDRVPQEIPRNPIDKAPERKDSVALQRQMAGDKSPTALSFEDQLKMFRLKIDQKSKQYQKEIDAMTPGITTTLDKNLTPASNKKTPVEKTKLNPQVGSLVAPQSGYPAAEKPKIPIPKPKPEFDIKVVGKGDTLWDIAGGDPDKVKKLKKLNPELDPNKMPIGYKLKLK